VRKLRAGLQQHRTCTAFPSTMQTVCAKFRSCLLKLFSHLQSLRRLTLHYFVVARALDCFTQTWDVLFIFPYLFFLLPPHNFLFIPFFNILSSISCYSICGRDPRNSLGPRSAYSGCLCFDSSAKPLVPAQGRSVGAGSLTDLWATGTGSAGSGWEGGKGPPFCCLHLSSHQLAPLI